MPETSANRSRPDPLGLALHCDARKLTATYGARSPQRQGFGLSDCPRSAPLPTVDRPPAPGAPRRYPTARQHSFSRGNATRGSAGRTGPPYG